MFISIDANPTVFICVERYPGTIGVCMFCIVIEKNLKLWKFALIIANA